MFQYFCFFAKLDSDLPPEANQIGWKRSGHYQIQESQEIMYSKMIQCIIMSWSVHLFTLTIKSAKQQLRRTRQQETTHTFGEEKKKKKKKKAEKAFR